MTGDQQEIFVQLGAELDALREAILANDVAAIEEQTANAGEWLVQLRALLDGRPYAEVSTDLRSLHVLARDTLVLLQKASRTVRALAAVYRLFFEQQASPELR